MVPLAGTDQGDRQDWKGIVPWGLQESDSDSWSPIGTPPVKAMTGHRLCVTHRSSVTDDCAQTHQTRGPMEIARLAGMARMDKRKHKKTFKHPQWAPSAGMPRPPPE